MKEKTFQMNSLLNRRNMRDKKRCLLVLPLLLFILFFSCTPSIRDSYEPQEWNDGLRLSTPEAEGVDRGALDDIYKAAGRLEQIYSLLVMKNGYLIAEKYFNGQRIEYRNPTASVTKSFTSALTGIALREQLLSSVDQKMAGYFPEIDWPAQDPRKSEITIRQILQMRSGYPWEEAGGYLTRLFTSSNWIPFLAEFPLSGDPGTLFAYSNFTAHIMGIITARAAGESLSSFGMKHLFPPLGISQPYWPVDGNGYCYGSGDMRLSPRDMIKFGLLYLDGGVYNNQQVVPAEWVADSLNVYSPCTYNGDVMTHIRNLGYGYLWWYGESGSHSFYFAWGHGGQSIFVVQDLQMVIVTTAAPEPEFDDEAWHKEKAVLELAGELIGRL